MKRTAKDFKVTLSTLISFSPYFFLSNHTLASSSFSSLPSSIIVLCVYWIHIHVCNIRCISYTLIHESCLFFNSDRLSRQEKITFCTPLFQQKISFPFPFILLRQPMTEVGIILWKIWNCFYRQILRERERKYSCCYYYISHR